MTVTNSATSCCQGGYQPRRPASDRQAVYLDQCYEERLMCSASNVYNNQATANEQGYQSATMSTI